MVTIVTLKCILWYIISRLLILQTSLPWLKRNKQIYLSNRKMNLNSNYKQAQYYILSKIYFIYVLLSFYQNKTIMDETVFLSETFERLCIISNIKSVHFA